MDAFIILAARPPRDPTLACLATSVLLLLQGCPNFWQLASHHPPHRRDITKPPPEKRLPASPSSPAADRHSIIGERAHGPSTRRPLSALTRHTAGAGTHARSRWRTQAYRGPASRRRLLRSPSSVSSRRRWPRWPLNSPAAEPAPRIPGSRDMQSIRYCSRASKENEGFLSRALQPRPDPTG